MLTDERRRRLVEAVNGKGSLTMTELCKKFDVSLMTIHRDVDHLASGGLVRKVHGGVVAVKKKSGTDLFDPRAEPFGERVSKNRAGKKAIAKHVARLVRSSRTLLLDSSTTAYYLAEELMDPAVGDLLVVTGSLPLFFRLHGHRVGLDVALHGGLPNPTTGSLLGPLAMAALAAIRFDFVVMSCQGVLDDDGSVFVSSVEEAALKHVYLERARGSILAVDASKFGHSGVQLLGNLDLFDHVIGERGALAAPDAERDKRSRPT